MTNSDQKMRLNIVHPGAGQLRYEIRGIVEFAKKLEAAGLEITWENIGDPVAKGEVLPEWMKQKVADAVKENSTYAYSPTKGLLSARHFLSEIRFKESGANLDPENIVFFNGLGDAITKIYTWLNPIARVLGPNPAYPTHSSIEGAHGRSPMLTYNLDPNNKWWPDVEDVRNKVKYNPSVAALLIINPDNPTGMVYPREILEEFVEIAREYNLFLIADEVYAKLAYPGSGFVTMAEIAKDIPMIIMRGLSKAMPWPGSRCGWIEIYNAEKSEAFQTYIQSVVEAKMNEVCSTTLPQAALPEILRGERFENEVAKRVDIYKKRAKVAADIINSSPYLNAVIPKAAFYLAVTFNDDFTSKKLDLTAASPRAKEILDSELAKLPADSFDQRFCYQLLAATGICTVPLSTGFNSHVPGFRMTLLESSAEKFIRTLKTITSVL